jgi:transposase
MWTEQTRGRMARLAKKAKRYPSDLTDEEWAQIAPLMPKARCRGRRRRVDVREIFNAIRYLVRSGCGWRMLPIHFGAWRNPPAPALQPSATARSSGPLASV